MLDYVSREPVGTSRDDILEALEEPPTPRLSGITSTPIEDHETSNTTTGSHWFPLVPGSGRNQLAALDLTGSGTGYGHPRRGDVPVGSSAPVPWLPTPANAPRMWPAWLAMFDHLADGAWHPRFETVEAMVAVSDVTPKTCTNLIGRAAHHGFVERRRRGGRYSDRLTVQGRETTPYLRGNAP